MHGAGMQSNDRLGAAVEQL